MVLNFPKIVLLCDWNFFVDADYGGDQQTRKSRTGWQGFLKDNHFCWSSQRQQTTALSTAESELTAIIECCKEVKRVRMLLAEIGLDMSKPTVVHCDNSAAREWASQTVSMRKAKHIEIRFHFSRECVEAGYVDPNAVKSDSNRADLFTKPLLRENSNASETKSVSKTFLGKFHLGILTPGGVLM